MDQVLRLNTPEKRKSTRIPSINLLHYTCRDASGNAVTQGMGKTLNVSEHGMLLETHVLFGADRQLSLAIALEDDLMAFTGTIVHTDPMGEDRYTYGIRFDALDETKRLFLKQYMQLLEREDAKAKWRNEHLSSAPPEKPKEKPAAENTP